MPRIMIIRHGEKPGDGTRGVDASGAHDADSLTVRGWQRAGALPQVFGLRPELTAPRFVFACFQSKHSQRALDTVTPLADRLGLRVNTSVARDDETRMASVARSCAGPVGPVAVIVRL